MFLLLMAPAGREKIAQRTAHSISTLQSVTRGLARVLIPHSSDCWNAACTYAPSGHGNWRSYFVYLEGVNS